MKTVILDFGHGGFLNGEYQTAGKRSPEFSDGSQYFEGVGNRVIGSYVVEILSQLCIPYVIVSDQQNDNSLDNRCIRANHFYDTTSRDCFLVSIHSNAGGGSGSEFYHYAGSDDGRRIARCFSVVYDAEYGSEYRNRGVKMANFQMLRDTKMPSVLLEYFFMDNEKECRENLLCIEGRRRIAKNIVAGIKKVIAL